MTKRSASVIGAGPAGLIAAEILAKAGLSVTVFDRMPSPARKFLMAGRGGLNITHSEDLNAFLGRYGTLPDVLRRAIEAFPPSALLDWVHGLGQETFVGSSGRIFPKAMKASPLLRAWLKRLDDLGVVLKTRHTLTGFGDGSALTFLDGAGSPVSLQSDVTILALGGASWPKLGSDGRWVEILENKGVRINALGPSNAGVHVAWSDHIKQKCEGQPLKRIAVRIADKSVRGDLILTANGLEGGPIYALGPEIRKALVSTTPAALHIDLKPELSEADLIARLDRPRHGQSTSNILRKALALSPAAITVAREGQALPNDPGALARHLKAVPLHVSQIAPIDRAISSYGGVAADVVTKDFMLAAAPGVFVAGEMLDWDAPTGGYLLQACFASGVAAARGATAWIEAAETPQSP